MKNKNVKFFSCNLFEDENFIIEKEFETHQDELVHVADSKYSKKNILYICIWKQKKQFDNTKPLVILPIKDNINLLNYTLLNFKINNFFDTINLIVVDDRSDEDIEKVCNKYDVNYLRIDNDKGFNFSMLNNIPALLAYKSGVKKIILWNSDLWIDKLEYFDTFLKKHIEAGAVISGSKLLYPHESLHNDKDSINILTHFPSMRDGKSKGTVQFGGSRWISSPNGSFVPIHYRRFTNKNDPRINCDIGTDFVTGALQIIDLEWFISIGGLNPSLSKILQDVDLCLRALEQNRKVMYFGKDIHFFHDESFNHFSNKTEKKIDNQYRSDNALFTKLWKEKIPSLIF